MPSDESAGSASLYNVPRKAPRQVRREKAYEDIDFEPRRNGKSRPSQSFKSLFNRRITPLPDLPRTFSPPNLPSPTSKGIYIDIDLLERERIGESLYTEISEKLQPSMLPAPEEALFLPYPRPHPLPLASFHQPTLSRKAQAQPPTLPFLVMITGGLPSSSQMWSRIILWLLVTQWLKQNL